MFSLITEVFNPASTFFCIVLSAIFMMSLICMQLFGGQMPPISLHDKQFPGEVHLGFIWNGVYTIRMVFDDFSSAFVTLFNM